MRCRRRENPWKGAILGMVGGVAGTIAMGLFWKAVKAATGEDPREAKSPEPGPLDDIAIAGGETRPGEGSTEAVGRIVYDDLLGQESPTKETRELLSELVHWGYGAVQGGLYGAVRGRREPPDLAGGALFGTGLWVFSELGLPLLGLGKGPTAYPPRHHAATWAAHAVYGTTAAAVTQILRRLI